MVPCGLTGRPSRRPSAPLGSNVSPQMNRRFALIGVSVTAGIGGAWLLLVAQSRVVGFALFFGGMSGLAIVQAWQRRDENLDRDAQSKWVDRVMEISDDTSLSGYGIETLRDLARVWHFLLMDRPVLRAYVRNNQLGSPAGDYRQFSFAFHNDGRLICSGTNLTNHLEDWATCAQVTYRSLQRGAPAPISDISKLMSSNQALQPSKFSEWRSLDLLSS